MPTITLQTSLLLDNCIENRNLLLFIQAVHESLTDGLVSSVTTDKLKSWNDIKSSYPEIVNSVNNEITTIAPGYFRSYKHEIKALSSKMVIKFHLKDVEIFESASINEIDKLKVAVYFLSDPLDLVKSFGPYILLSVPNDKTNTFMLELSEYLTINSYQ